MSVGLPAYKAILSVSGTSAAFTGEACTHTSGNSYQVNTSTRRLIDPKVARTWKDTGVAIPAANIVSEDLFFGIVTLTAPAGGAVTLDANKMPIAAVANVKTANLDETNESEETTVLNSGGAKGRTQTLIDASVDATILDDLTPDLDPILAGTQNWRTIIAGRTPVLIQIDPTGTNAYVFRAWMVAAPGKTAYDPTKVVNSTLKLSVADQGNANALAGASWGVP